MTSVKLFQIGFNKCATRTLAHYFEANGYPSMHYLRGKLARNLFKCKQAQTKPFERWPETVMFSDMEYISEGELLEGYKEYAYLDQWYPDAVFLLNTRDVSDWLISRMLHETGTYLRTYMAAYSETDPIRVLERWKSDWDTHLAAVRSYFSDRPGKLVEFDIDRHGPEDLTKQFEGVFRLDPQKWKYRGKTRPAAGRSKAEED